MSEVAVATIVAKNYLSYARVLAESFLRHHSNIPFFVLLADEVDGYFDPDAEPFRLMRLDEIGIPNLHRFRFHYSQQELSYASTAYLLDHLLDRGFTGAAFLKQESLVLGDLTPILGSLKRHSIILTPHLLEPFSDEDRYWRELNILQSGIYNVGFLGVSATPTGRAFLAWWKDRLYKYCRHDVPNGMHFEQRWLDLVPVFFDDFHIVRNPGFNIGHWNLPERKVSINKDAVSVNGQLCSYIRFSGFDPDRPEAVTRYSSRLHMSKIGQTAELFNHYASLLKASGYHETKTWPYAYSRFDNGVEVTDAARKVYRELDEMVVQDFGDPLITGPENSFFKWLERYNRQNRGLRGATARAARVWRANRELGGTRMALSAILGAARRRLLRLGRYE